MPEGVTNLDAQAVRDAYNNFFAHPRLLRSSTNTQMTSVRARLYYNDTAFVEASMFHRADDLSLHTYIRRDVWNTSLLI